MSVTITATNIPGEWEDPDSQYAYSYDGVNFTETGGRQYMYGHIAQVPADAKYIHVNVQNLYDLNHNQIVGPVNLVDGTAYLWSIAGNSLSVPPPPPPGRAVKFWLKNLPSNVLTWRLEYGTHPYDGNYAGWQNGSGEAGYDKPKTAVMTDQHRWVMIVTNPDGIPTPYTQFFLPARNYFGESAPDYSYNLNTKTLEVGTPPPPPPPAPYLTEIIISPAAPLYLAPGEKAQIQVSGKFFDGHIENIMSTVKLISLGPAMATVTAGGLITAISDGFTGISAEQGGLYGTLAVGVVGANTLIAGRPYKAVISNITNTTKYTGTSIPAPYTFFLRVDITGSGGVPLIGIAENLTLGPGETRRVEYSFSIPLGLSGTYTADAVLKTGDDMSVLAKANTRTGKIIQEV